MKLPRRHRTRREMPWLQRDPARFMTCEVDIDGYRISGSYVEVVRIPGILPCEGTPMARCETCGRLFCAAHVLTHPCVARKEDKFQQTHAS